MKWRDLTILDFHEEHLLAVACDSAGGIGGKLHDVVKAPPLMVGYHTAKVAMLELICVHATPLLLSNTLSVEMDPTGAEMMKGIEMLLMEYDPRHAIAITGSTEENFKVSATGIGITILGEISKSQWPLKKTQRCDLAVMIGEAAYGLEVLQKEKEKSLGLHHARMIRGLPFVSEVVPGGSRGMHHEIEIIETSENLRFVPTENGAGVIHKSCGPATALLVTLHREYLPKLKEMLEIPVCVLGTFL